MFEKQEITLGDWLVYQIIMSIPIVNVIFFFYTLANPKTNKTMQNYLLSGLIMAGVSLAFALLILGPGLLQFLQQLPDLLNQLSSLA